MNIEEILKNNNMSSIDELGVWLYNEYNVKKRYPDFFRKDLGLEIDEVKLLLKECKIIIFPTHFCVVDYTGQTHNGIKFVRMTDDRSGSHIKWECVCSCGNIWITASKTVFRGGKCKKCCKYNTGVTKKYGDEWVKLYDNGNGLSIQEIGIKYNCTPSTVAQHLKKMGVFVNKNIPGKNHHAYKGFGDISGTFYNDIISGAHKRGIDCNITIEEVDAIFQSQNHRCALSGRKLIAARNRYKEKGNASFDRIDSTKGYFYENCQFLDSRVNKAKNNMTDQEFKDMCRSVVKQENKELKRKKKPSKQLELAF